MISLIDTLLNGIIAILKSLFNGLFDLLSEILTKKHKTEYSASFGSIQEQLQKKGGGFRVGFDWGNSLVEGHNHMICLGGSGSKKSSCVCFPTLLQSHESSYVIFDSSRELFNGTAQYLNSIGYAIDVFDYDDYQKSIGFNYLEKAQSETDIYRMAQVLNKNSNEGAQNDYWSQSAEDLIGFFSYLLFKYADKEYVNYPNVLNMIQVFSFAGAKIDKWVAQHAEEKDLNKYKSIVATPEKTLKSTLATATNTLSIFNSPNIAAITSRDTLSFDKFRQEKRALYICGSPSMSRFCKGISACFFESFFAHILQKLPDSSLLPITFMIDEASSFRLESLPMILELGRKYRISVATLWQDFGQVEHIYGKNQASNILANSKLKVYMPSGQPLSTCRMLEELLGKYSYESEHGQKSRELLTAQEIFQLDKILVLNGNNKPLLVPPKPYFMNSKLTALTEKQRYEVKNNAMTFNNPLLKF